MPDTLSPLARQARDNLSGILLALVATALFATFAAMAKIASQDYHFLQVLFFRQIVVFLSTVPSIARAFPGSLVTRRPGLNAIRLAGAFVALSCSVWAVAVLPLTTATTLAFAQVFFVALLAMHILGEKVGPHRIGAIAVGFLGVLIVMRPGAEGLIDWHALIPVAAAMGAAVAIIAIRQLSQTESVATLIVYQSSFVGLMAAIPMFWVWKTPDFDGLVFLLAMGIVASIAQWIGITALRFGEATVITNVEYMKLFWAGVLGYLLFTEIPDAYTIAGAVLIIGSSLYIYHRESVNRRRA